MKYRQKRELVCTGVWPYSSQSFPPSQPHLGRKWLLCCGCCLECQWLHINACFVPCLCMRWASQGRFVLPCLSLCITAVSAHQQGMAQRGLWATTGIHPPLQAGERLLLPPTFQCLSGGLTNSSSRGSVQRELSHLSVTMVTSDLGHYPGVPGARDASVCVTFLFCGTFSFSW